MTTIELQEPPNWERALMLCLMLCLMPACANKPLIVDVPVYKRAVPPAELSEWQPGRLPLWIEPSELASSCLTPEGEQELRGLLHSMLTQIRAWEAWAGDLPK